MAWSMPTGKAVVGDSHTSALLFSLGKQIKKKKKGCGVPASMREAGKEKEQERACHQSPLKEVSSCAHSPLLVLTTPFALRAEYYNHYAESVGETFIFNATASIITACEIQFYTKHLLSVWPCCQPSCFLQS